MFEKIKQKWSERIQRNTVKSKLTYVTKEGIKLINKKKFTEENLPDKYRKTETVYIKRSVLPLGDWSRIYPPLNEDGTRIKWANLIFGGWRNFVKLAIILTIVGFVIINFKDNATVISELQKQLQFCILP